MSDHDIGDILRIDRTFLDEDGEAADPTTVVLTLYHPSGTSSTPSVTNDTEAVGRYYADVTPDEPSRWFYHWETTGDPTVSEWGSFFVRRNPV